jgi:hypothetical protein
MDTDYLTPMAYETIILAWDILDVLPSEIGVSASRCKTEDEFLRGVRTHLRAILRSAREYLDDWNYLDTVDKRKFRAGVKNLLAYVEATLSTPYEQRGEPPFKWVGESSNLFSEGEFVFEKAVHKQQALMVREDAVLHHHEED